MFRVRHSSHRSHKQNWGMQASSSPNRHIWRMFREYLVPQLGCELIAAELVQLTLVLQ